jgi:hypothetical protein
MLITDTKTPRRNSAAAANEEPRYRIRVPILTGATQQRPRSHGENLYVRQDRSLVTSSQRAGSGRGARFRARRKAGARAHLGAAAIAGVVVAAAFPEAAAARAEVVAAVRLARPLREPRRVPVLLPAAAPVQPQPPHRPCNEPRIRAPTTRQPRDPPAVRPAGDLSGTREK